MPDISFRRKFVRRAFAAVTAVALWAVGLAVAAPTAQAVIEPSACAISGPLTGRIPNAVGAELPGAPSYVHLQATDGHGTYAGVAFSSTGKGFVFSVIRREPTGEVRVLGRFTYQNTSISADNSVRVVGFDPWGGFVLHAQRTGPDDFRSIPVRFDKAGRRVDLQMSPAWRSIELVGVSDAGTVLGTATRTDGRNQVISWAGPGKGTVSVRTTVDHDAGVVTASGDWYESNRNNGGAYAHPKGFTNSPAFPLLVGGVQPVGVVDFASRTKAYATLARSGSFLGSEGGSKGYLDLHPVGFLTSLRAVGREDDVVGTYPGGTTEANAPRVLVTASGKAYRMPAEFGADPFFFTHGSPRETVDPFGQVVYTAPDGLPRLMTCPR